MKTTLTVEEQDAIGKKIYDKYPANKELYDEKYTKFAYQAGVIDGYIHAIEENPDHLSNFLAWWEGKGEQYRNNTLYVNAAKDYLNFLNKKPNGM